MSLFEAGRGRLSVTSSLLFGRQYGLVGPLVRLCRCSSRCDIRLVTADTAKSTSESATGTKECFRRGINYPEVLHGIPLQPKWKRQ